MTPPYRLGTDPSTDSLTPTPSTDSYVRTYPQTDKERDQVERDSCLLSNAREPHTPELNPSDMTLRATRPHRAEPAVPTGHCCVYFLWSEDWQLLYVGLTDSPERRFTQHRRGKPWWRSVHHMEVEQYASRARAAARESEAIRRWNPLHNIVRPRVTQ